MRKFILMILTFLCALCFGTACASSAGITLDALPELDAVYGVTPDEGIVIDGVGDEEIWQDKNYFKRANTDYDATYYVTTHLTEKGVYIYAYSEDVSVRYSNRNNYTENTHFYFIIAASPDVTIYNDGLCRMLKIDTSDYTSPTNFTHTSASAVFGEVNSGKTEGMSVEVFATWDQLGVSDAEDHPTEIRLYNAYRYVSRRTYGYISNALASANPGTYQKFDKDGYIDTGDKTNGLDSSEYGLGKSGGLELTENGMQATASGAQTAFFKGYSDKFVAKVDVTPTGKTFKNDTGTAYNTSKAGIILYSSSGDYHAIMFDVRNSNVQSGKFVSNRLYTVTNYPTGQIRTNVVYDGESGKYDSLELTVIKDGGQYYYAIDGELAYIEELSWFKDVINVGVYSDYAGVVFSDYSYSDCSHNSKLLGDEINEIAYKVSYENNENVLFETDKFAVKAGETVTASLYVRSGYTLTAIFNNGVDVTEEAYVTADGASFTLGDVEENVNLTATVEEIADNISVTGVASLPSGTPLMFANITAQSETSFPGYYVMTDETGAYTMKLPANNTYEFEVGYDGYRTTRLNVAVENTDKADENISVANYLVGGTVTSKIAGREFMYASNTAAWDMTQESESKVVLDLQDRTSGGAIYFSDVVSSSAIINVTITNRTDKNIGVYESDPGAGVIVSQRRQTQSANTGYSAVYNLYQKGVRVRGTGAYSGSGFYYNGALSSKDIRTTGDSIHLTFIRLENNYYMFIDDKLVYSRENTYIQGEAAYGFTYDSSSTVKFEFADYSIVYGEEAVEQAYGMLYSKFNYDTNALEIEGLDQGRGLYNTSPVIRAKDLSDGNVAVVTVNGETYYLSEKNNSLAYAISDWRAGGMPDVNIEYGEVAGYLVSGKVNVAADIVALGENGRAEFTTDANGNYAVYLPTGTYKLIASASGYLGAYKEATVEQANVTVADISLTKSQLSSMVTLKGNRIESRTTAYVEKYNEEALRQSMHADATGNGGAIYFGETGENALIKFSFINHGGTESDPGIGLRVTTNNGDSNYLRLLFKRAWLYKYEKVNKPSDVAVNDNTGYNITQKKSENIFDVCYARLDNKYYVWMKLSTETEYALVGSFESNEIDGEAAYGITVTVGNGLTFSAEFFDYSITTDRANVESFVTENTESEATGE